MNYHYAHQLTALLLLSTAPFLPATGVGADPTLFIAILVIATLAIAGGIFLLRRRPPS